MLPKLDVRSQIHDFDNWILPAGVRPRAPSPNVEILKTVFLANQAAEPVGRPANTPHGPDALPPSQP
jgi:hypothetical protein